MTTIEKLTLRMSKSNSLACVGLDPDYDKIPTELKRFWRSKERVVFLFLKNVIDLTAEHCCAFKIQKAFFDCLPGGHKLLGKVIEYIHSRYPEIPVFVDCKIGDIDNTMQAYLSNLFLSLKADGIVVNPYMGDDVFKALSNFPEKAIIVLVQTSNPNAAIVQNHHGLWEHILDLVVNRWNWNKNLIPVISSNSADTLRRARELIPTNMPILFAGVGAQGGDYLGLKELVNSDNSQVFVNSSRGVLYPYDKHDKDWRNKIKNTAKHFQEELNRARSA